MRRQSLVSVSDLIGLVAMKTLLGRKIGIAVAAHLRCRYGILDAVHYNNSMFHLDVVGANWGFGLGLVLHGILDYGFGNINPGVPMVP
jgi:hypothetical protein